MFDLSGNLLGVGWWSWWQTVLLLVVIAILVGSYLYRRRQM